MSLRPLLPSDVVGKILQQIQSDIGCIVQNPPDRLIVLLLWVREWVSHPSRSAGVWSSSSRGLLLIPPPGLARDPPTLQKQTDSGCRENFAPIWEVLWNVKMRRRGTMGMGARQDCQSVLLLLLAPRIIRGFSMVHEEAGQQVGIISHPQQPVNSSNMCHAMIQVSLKPSIDVIVYYMILYDSTW